MVLYLLHIIIVSYLLQAYLSKVGTPGLDPYQETFLIYREKFEKSGFFFKLNLKKLNVYSF